MAPALQDPHLRLSQARSGDRVLTRGQPTDAQHPRGLTRQQAAVYCGLSPAGFDDWVRRRLVPGPIPGTQRWDRKAIDLALDRASGIREQMTEAATAYDDWRSTRAS
jgi:hypothetical protein